MLFRDNLIIRLVHQLKETLRLNKANRSSFIHSSDIQLSPIYLQMRKEYKHIFRVLARVFEKTRVSDYIPLREKQKYQVTNLCVKSKIVTYPT